MDYNGEYICKREDIKDMIIIMKPNASEEAVGKIKDLIESNGLQAHLSKGTEVTIVGVVGDKSKLQGKNIEMFEGVDKIVAVTETYKLVNKKFHPEDSVITIGNAKIGPGHLTIMAGPCAIENHDMVLETAFAVKKAGAQFLRGGAYKPRTSPYAFQGLEEEGLKYMKEAREATGLNIVCEVTSLRALETSVKYVDMIQIGARNMQNFELLKEAGKAGIPVLLKRGLSATIDEWLNAAEYIASEGNTNIVLCERGIRTFETATRNTLDISAVPVIRAKSHLPIIIDPSHATGVRAYIEPISKAALAVGADGLIVEVHPRPSCALSDGPQSLTFEQFENLIEELKPYAKLAGRTS
jgi:3-deoxy-7-phosphoheptulonate synthase